MRLPKLFFDSDNDGKAIGIDMFIGKRPYASIGNSNGDREMLEWTGAGEGARLKMLVHHDDAVREYAYGPADGLPDTKVGTFPYSKTYGRGEDTWLDSDQHEERLPGSAFLRLNKRRAGEGASCQANASATPRHRVLRLNHLHLHGRAQPDRLRQGGMTDRIDRHGLTTLSWLTTLPAWSGWYAVCHQQAGSLCRSTRAVHPETALRPAACQGGQPSSG